MKRCERQSQDNVSEDFKRKLHLFDYVVKPCYAEMLKLQERHMNPTCILITDKGSSASPRNTIQKLRDTNVITWKLPIDIENIMTAYRQHIKELWYSIFGFEMKD